MLGTEPRLILVAKQDIEPNTELLYDYGDRFVVLDIFLTIKLLRGVSSFQS